ncbi:MAG TPA: DHH family phosphoesterase [Ramlibacter sp.]|nr:DHH family phosphoesterase [Ramlibacter sp.]
MTLWYAFNGDADGLCALQQLRLADAREAKLVTGVKRDIQLLRRIDAAAGDEITVLDVSLDQNRDALLRLLDTGASVRYFDHHHAGELPRHARFECHIDEAADVCSSILVDRHLGGRFRAWALVAAFGDGLPGAGHALARSLDIDGETCGQLQQLGICLNYNAYGETISDLHVDPAELAARMLPFAHPLDFIRTSDVPARLAAGYEDDMRRARALAPARSIPGATLVLLPGEPWARRVMGVFANDLRQEQPDNALALLSPKASGGFAVSVRVSERSAVGADEFCRGFETGGGRRLAAGINHLPPADVEHFTACFEAQYRLPSH